MFYLQAVCIFGLLFWHFWAGCVHCRPCWAKRWLAWEMQVNLQAEEAAAASLLQPWVQTLTQLQSRVLQALWAYNRQQSQLRSIVSKTLPAISVAYPELVMNFPAIFVFHDSMIPIFFIPTWDVVFLYIAAKNSTATKSEGHLFFEREVFQPGFLCLFV